MREIRPAGAAQSAGMIVLLTIGVWAVYGHTSDFPLIFDDQSSIVENPSITRLWPLVGDTENPGPLDAPTDLPVAGRPLVNLTFALNYYFGLLEPAGYRRVNIVLHLLSATLLWAIVRRTLQLDYFAGRFVNTAGPLAVAVALIWALHPLQTESVVYVTQRTELIVGFCYLATLYCSLRYWAATSRGLRTTWLALVTLACLAGMASKEMMVSAPLVVLLFERTFIAGSFRKVWQQSWPLYLGLAATWILLWALNYNGPRASSAGFHLEVPAYAWWLTQAKVLLLYLKLVLWPWPLCIHYEMPYLTTAADAWPWVLPVVLLVIGTLILLWRRNVVGYVGAWVLLILSPTLIVPIVTEVAAERRMYLPLAALTALFVVGTFEAVQWLLRPESQHRRVGGGSWEVATLAVTVVTLVLIYATVSVNRLEAYEDELYLWQGTLAQQPENLKAHCCVAKLMVDRGRFPEAIEHYHQALRLDPDYIEARSNLGIALFHVGRAEEAMEQFRLALETNPDYADAHNNLGSGLGQLGRQQEAIVEFEWALKLKPNYADAHCNLGNALMATGRYDEAIKHYRQAVRLKLGFQQAYINLALAYAQVSQPADAIAAAQKALNLARSTGQTAEARQISVWLANYRAGLADSADPRQPSEPQP